MRWCASVTWQIKCTTNWIWRYWLCYIQGKYNSSHCIKIPQLLSKVLEEVKYIYIYDGKETSNFHIILTFYLVLFNFSMHDIMVNTYNLNAIKMNFPINFFVALWDLMLNACQIDGNGEMMIMVLITYFSRYGWKLVCMRRHLIIHKINDELFVFTICSHTSFCW